MAAPSVSTGASFKAFTVETGSLKDNEVWALQEDDENALSISLAIFFFFFFFFFAYLGSS